MPLVISVPGRLLYTMVAAYILKTSFVSRSNVNSLVPTFSIGFCTEAGLPV